MRTAVFMESLAHARLVWHRFTGVLNMHMCLVHVPRQCAQYVSRACAACLQHEVLRRAGKGLLAKQRQPPQVSWVRSRQMQDLL